MNQIPIIIYIIVFLFAFLLIFGKVFIAWFISRSKNYPLSLGQLFGMNFRKQNLYQMIKAHNVIKENNLDLTLEQVEIFVLRNGIIEDLLKEAQDHKRNYKPFNIGEFSKLYFDTRNLIN